MIKYAGFIIILLFGIGLGLWIGQQRVAKTQANVGLNERKPLYYRHPMNPKITSPTPAKDEMGMDYLPVYAEDQNLPEAKPKSGRILYYRHPMGAPDTSPGPKKDEMGMDYVPVYETEPEPSGQIRISPEKIQKLGVTTETVAKRTLTRSIRALGSIQADERRVHAVTLKFEGWIQHLYVNATGQAVKRGQPLLEIYSPELVTAQQEYLIARQGKQALRQASAQARGTAEQLAENALQRLHYWDIAPAQLQHLQTLEKPLDTLPLTAPVNGVVLEKPAVEGMRFMPGELLFRIADLSTVWLLADVFEQDIGGVRQGQAVQVHIDAYPERLFSGKVDFIYPTLATATRTVQVRIELPNDKGLLKPGLYGSVALAAPAEKDARLAVPDSAVIDSGTRRIVLLQRSEGRFEPHAVKLGRQADGYREVLEGLEAGDEVVTRANFLIDAESNLKSALDSFGGYDADASQAVPEAQPGGR
ncbi:putative membrane fusion protein SilB [Candidatus Methylobacter favarea]|uniref:Putative membrane fusion protein SilB n=1 Tax=Candidatus Methylobacter favarea TaxID=2707345 RepID=A0A8S0WYX1_9GAMM|nr:efflux RND transporter periplasmic adaptor subunit [Candidatus Methylobacter favarea]CAA9889823.1 putative membrane fusion protein SilB [Candidatus Methylobacter favarea]